LSFFMVTPIDVPLKRATNPVPVQPKRGFVASLVSTRPTHRTPAATIPVPPSVAVEPPEPPPEPPAPASRDPPLPPVPEVVAAVAPPTPAPPPVADVPVVDAPLVVASELVDVVPPEVPPAPADIVEVEELPEVDDAPGPVVDVEVGPLVAAPVPSLVGPLDGQATSAAPSQNADPPHTHRPQLSPMLRAPIDSGF
jgi:hypothetical protein